MNVTLEKKFEFFFEKISENGRGRPRPLRESENFFLFTSPVVSATTSNKNFQKIRYRAPYIRFQTDRQTDGRTHEHSEIINIDIYRYIQYIMVHN